MSELALIFFIISFGIIIIIDIVFIIFCVIMSGRVNEEEENERVKEVYRKRNTK